MALRQTFFHNGVFHTLRDAVAFYVTRETDPGRWYPRNPDGTVRLYDDLPPLVEKYGFTLGSPPKIVKNKHGDSSGVRGAAWLWPE